MLSIYHRPIGGYNIIFYTIQLAKKKNSYLSWLPRDILKYLLEYLFMYDYKPIVIHYVFAPKIKDYEHRYFYLHLTDINGDNEKNTIFILHEEIIGKKSKMKIHYSTNDKYIGKYIIPMVIIHRNGCYSYFGKYRHIAAYNDHKYYNFRIYDIGSGKKTIYNIDYEVKDIRMIYPLTICVKKELYNIAELYTKDKYAFFQYMMKNRLIDI
jgi:hypothetical protein